MMVTPAECQGRNATKRLVAAFNLSGSLVQMIPG